MIDIFVSPDEAGSLLRVSSPSFTVEAGRVLSVLGVHTHFSHLSASTGDSTSMTLSISTMSGGLLMLPIIREIASNSFIPSRWSSQENFTVTGDERAINQVLTYLKFKGRANDTIMFNLTQTGGTSTHTSNAAVSVVVTKIALYTDVDENQAQVPDIVSEASTDLKNIVSKAYSDSFIASYGILKNAKVDLVITCETGTMTVDTDLYQDFQNFQINSVGGLVQMSVKGSHLDTALQRIFYLSPKGFGGSVLFQINMIISGDAPGVIDFDFLALVSPASRVGPIDSLSSTVFESDLKSVSSAHVYDGRDFFGQGLMSSEPSSASLLLNAIESIVGADSEDVLSKVEITSKVGAISISRAFLDSSLDIFTTEPKYSEPGAVAQRIVYFAKPVHAVGALNLLIYHPVQYYDGSDSINITVSSLVVDAGVSDDVYKLDWTPINITRGLVIPIKVVPSYASMVQCYDRVKLQEDDGFGSLRLVTQSTSVLNPESVPVR